MDRTFSVQNPVDFSPADRARVCEALLRAHPDQLAAIRGDLVTVYSSDYSEEWEEVSLYVVDIRDDVSRGALWHYERVGALLETWCKSICGQPATLHSVEREQWEREQNRAMEAYERERAEKMAFVADFWAKLATRYVTYLSEGHEFYAQYCGAQAGFYPGISRKARREAEIKAKKDGVRQLPRYAHRLKEVFMVIGCSGELVPDFKW